MKIGKIPLPDTIALLSTTFTRYPIFVSKADGEITRYLFYASTITRGDAISVVNVVDLFPTYKREYLYFKGGSIRKCKKV